MSEVCLVCTRTEPEVVPLKLSFGCLLQVIGWCCCSSQVVLQDVHSRGTGWGVWVWQRPAVCTCCCSIAAEGWQLPITQLRG